MSYMHATGAFGIERMVSLQRSMSDALACPDSSVKDWAVPKMHRLQLKERPSNIFLTSLTNAQGGWDCMSSNYPPGWSIARSDAYVRLSSNPGMPIDMGISSGWLVKSGAVETLSVIEHFFFISRMLQDILLTMLVTNLRPNHLD